MFTARAEKMHSFGIEVEGEHPEISRDSNLRRPIDFDGRFLSKAHVPIVSTTRLKPEHRPGQLIDYPGHIGRFRPRVTWLVSTNGGGIGLFEAKNRFSEGLKLRV
jgi:hypothetical protein